MLQFKFLFLLFTIYTNYVISDSDDSAFDYDMTSTCTIQENNICTEWKHSGVIKRANSIGCFPENTYVITLNGLTYMKDLHIGDHLLGYDIYSGSTVFSEMPTWFHFVRNETLEYIVLLTEDGSLTASPFHNIGFSGNSDIAMFLHASKFDISENLIGFEYSPSSLETTNVQEHKIVDISTKTLMGMYAPYTLINNYFVSDDGKHFYLAHSYAVIENPIAYEYVVGKTFDVLSMFVKIDESQNSFYNPIAKALQSVLQLCENPMSVVKYLRSSARKLSSNNNDDEQVKLVYGYNALEITDFLTVLAHTHATSNSPNNSSNIIHEYDNSNSTSYEYK